MTLQAVRKQFINMSGRFDLVDDTVQYGDNGADFYIQSGQDWLDVQGDIYKANGRAYQTKVIGDWYALIQYVRAIHTVWVSNSDGVKWKLEKTDLDSLRSYYPKDPVLIDSGPPCIWAPVTARVLPEVADEVTIDQFGSTIYTEIATDHHTYNGLIWMPPTDEAITLEVHGSFFQPRLSADGDKNYWSERYPFILVMAALRTLEISYRNTEGKNDWERAIASELIGIELDWADQESQEYQRMEG